MLRTRDILSYMDDLPKKYKSRRAYETAVRKKIETFTGSAAVKAWRNKGGTCQVCGENGRCSGWHTWQDLADAVDNWRKRKD